MHPTDTPIKKMLRLSESMALQIRRYQHRNELPNESLAIRRLLTYALTHDPSQPPPTPRRTRGSQL